MRITMLKLAGLAVAFSATVASADMTASFFLDARDSYLGVGGISMPGTGLTDGYANNPNGGGRGDGQTIYLTPKLGNTGQEVQVTDMSKATMTLYVDVDSSDSNEVLAAVGLNISIAAPAANQYQLLGATATIHNSAAEVGGGLAGAPWNDTAESTAFTTSGGGIKAVRVPVEDNMGSPVFNASLGITNNDTEPYRLATIDLEADSCAVAGHRCVASLNVFMSVNNLLVTAVTSPGSSPAVALDLGYAAGSPEMATGDGSTQGTTSATPDAVVVIRNKGDFNSDGNYNNVDIGSILGTLSISAKTHEQVWVGDFNGDGRFNNVDLNFALLFLNNSSPTVCPICIP